MKKCFAMLLSAILLFAYVQAFAEIEFAGQIFTGEEESIDLGETETNYKDVHAFLELMPKLKQIDMFGTTLEGNEMNKLKRDFPDLKVNCVIHLANKHYIRTDAKVFSTLHGSCSYHSSKVLQPLEYCTELMALDIGHNDLSDISFLGSLKKLRVLILACNENIRNVSVLAELKDLEYLELFSNSVKDISALSGLTHLLDLNLSYNKIKDLTPVLGLKQLMRLWVPQCGVQMNKENLAMLQEALPDTTIMHYGHPTNHGWRRDDDDGTEHPHYTIIYQMFRGEEYIPFAESAPVE